MFSPMESRRHQTDHNRSTFKQHPAYPPPPAYPQHPAYPQPPTYPPPPPTYQFFSPVYNPTYQPQTPPVPDRDLREKELMLREAQLAQEKAQFEMQLAQEKAQFEMQLAQERESKNRELSLKENELGLMKERNEIEREKIRAKLMIADNYLDAMKAQQEKEVSYLDRFHRQKLQYGYSVNNQMRRLSTLSTDFHAPGELTIYGTAACPTLKTQEVKKYVKSHVIPTLYDVTRQHNTKESLEGYESIHTSVQETIQSLSFECEYNEEGRLNRDFFVELSAVDTLFKRMEKATWDEKQKIEFDAMLRDSLFHTHCNLPFSSLAYKAPLNATHYNDFIKDLTDRFDLEVYGRPLNDDFISPDNILPPDHLFPSSPEEELTIKEEDQELRTGQTLLVQKTDVVGTFQDSVSSVKLTGQMVERTCRYLTHFFTDPWMMVLDPSIHTENEKFGFIENLHRLRNMIKNGLVIARTMLTTVKQQLAQGPQYMPFFARQMIEDQRYKKAQIALPPIRRAFPVNTKGDFIKRLQSQRVLAFVCRTCGRELDELSLSRGHVNPRAGGRGGTDYEHNILVQCKPCNHLLGDAHLFFHQGFTPLRLLPEGPVYF